MAYQVSPSAQKPPPLPYAPYQNAASASASASPPGQIPFAQPPAKRQRLSPDVRSPQNGSPAYAQSPVYGQAYSHQPPTAQSPYSPQSYAASPQNSFNTPQPYSPAGQQWPSQQHPGVYSTVRQQPSQLSPPPPTTTSSMMPPPPRPNKEEKEEKSGVDDISDSLFGSGINLKDEENYLHNTWNNRHSHNESFNTTQSSSFGSNGTSVDNSFSYLTQNTSFNNGPNGVSAGALGQAQSQEQIENDYRRKREQAARREAEHKQHHLNNQFLQVNCLRNRMHQRATETAVRLDIAGVYVRNPEPERPQTQVLLDVPRTAGIAAVGNKPEAMIEAGANYESILSLVSMATAERMRGLLDEAYALARARRYGDHGRVVPPDFADLAEGQGKASLDTVVPESITGSQWDKVPEQPPKAVDGEAQTNGELSTPTPQLMQTLSFDSALNIKLREIAGRDRTAEKERQRKREARRRKADNAASDEHTAMDTAVDTPSAADLAAAARKTTKKEQAKKAKEAQQNSEKQSFNQSNQTAAMMALGGRKNKYSWMSGGVSNMPTNKFAKTSSGSSTPKPPPEPEKAAAAAGSTTDVDEASKRQPSWGDWREDDVHGRSIQLRDWVLVLERDGKEKKALQKALHRLA